MNASEKRFVVVPCSGIGKTFGSVSREAAYEISRAMTYAAAEGRTEIVRLLIGRGVDPNRTYANDLTALMWAAGYGKTETVKALLDAGARADLRDNRGKTALDIAREQKFDETARLLETAAKS